MDAVNGTQTQTVQCGLPATDFVRALDRAIDKPDGVMVLGQTPGSSRFIGVVDGDSFRIRKKNEMLNPFARELRGKVKLDEFGKPVVECSFQELSAPQLFFMLGGMAGIPLILFFASFILADDKVAFIYSTGIYIALLAPAVMLVIGVAFWQSSKMLSFRSDEELLDCVRRIASGAAPVVD